MNERVKLSQERKRTAEQLKSRRELFFAQNNRCYYCNEKLCDYDRSVDHFVPKSRGGSDDESNWKAACKTCNRNKGSMMPEEFVAECMKKLAEGK